MPKINRMTELQFAESLGWPMWPVLPLMKRPPYDDKDGDVEGFLFAIDPPVEPVVYFANVMTLNDKMRHMRQASDSDRVTWAELLAEIPQTRFASLEEVLKLYRID